MTHPAQTQATTIITTHSPEATEALGERLGAQLLSGDIIALSGELGAGKTCFVRGLARGWGAVEHPTSPTFTLINHYHRQIDAARMAHVDCYRLTDARDAWSTGLEDVLASDDIVVIEWPERIRGTLPDAHLWIGIDSLGETERVFHFSASGRRAGELIGALG